MKKSTLYIMAGFVLLVFLASGCAAGPESRFAEKPAGFWAGLWHGLICVVTFVISLFTDSVGIYEANNTGGWYNFGFLLGIFILMSGGGSCRRKKKTAEEKEWDEVAEKVEKKILAGIKGWVDEEKRENDEEWEEIGRKVEAKVKRELKNWAEK